MAVSAADSPRAHGPPSGRDDSSSSHGTSRLAFFCDPRRHGIRRVRALTARSNAVARARGRLRRRAGCARARCERSQGDGDRSGGAGRPDLRARDAGRVRASWPLRRGRRQPLAPPRAGSRARGGQDRAARSAPGRRGIRLGSLRRANSGLVPRPARRAVGIRPSSAYTTGTKSTTACTATRRCGQRSIAASANAISPGAHTSTGTRRCTPTRRANRQWSTPGPSTPLASATSVHDSRGRRLASTIRALAGK